MLFERILDMFMFEFACAHSFTLDELSGVYLDKTFMEERIISSAMLGVVSRIESSVFRREKAVAWDRTA